MSQQDNKAITSIHIDKLRLRGFSRLEGQQIRDGMEQRLNQLAHASPKPDPVRDVEWKRLQFPAIEISDMTLPRNIGKLVAEAVWRGLLHE